MFASILPTIKIAGILEAILMKLEVIFLLIMLFVASMGASLISHELTHLALAEEARGICIGLCKTGNPPSTALGLAYAKSYPPESRNEFYPNAVGIITATIFAAIGVVSIVRIVNKRDEKQ